MRPGPEGAPWDTVWLISAINDLNRLDDRAIDRIVDAVLRYAVTGAGDVRRLQNVRPPEWRLRVGDLRVRLVIVRAQHTIVVLRVLARGRAYRD